MKFEIKTTKFTKKEVIDPYVETNIYIRDDRNYVTNYIQSEGKTKKEALILAYRRIKGEFEKEQNQVKQMLTFLEKEIKNVSRK